MSSVITGLIKYLGKEGHRVQYQWEEALPPTSSAPSESEFEHMYLSPLSGCLATQDETGPAVEEAIRAYRKALPMGGGYEFSLTSLDRLGQPLWAIGIWGDNHIFVDGFGYGPTDSAAKVSALGEATENYFASRALRTMPRRRASYRQLKSAGIDAVDPVTLCLNAGCNYSPDRIVTWVEALRYPSKTPVLVPIEAAAIGFSDISPTAENEQWLMTPITNGLGAGLSLDQALFHGLLELIQRDGDSVSFRALDQGVAINLDGVESEVTKCLLAKLDEQGIDVIAKLAEVNCGIPVIYVVGADRDIDRPPFPLMLSACGEAADPDREHALEKALCEYISSRSRKRFMHGPLSDVATVAPQCYMDSLFATSYGGDEPRALASVMSWVEMPREDFFEIIRDPILSVRSRVPFTSLPRGERTLEYLLDRLSENGMELIYLDFSEPNSGVSAVKAIVPGLEVETISYGRIGARNVERLLRSNSPLVSVQKQNPGPATRRISLTNEQEITLGGPAWLHMDVLETAVGKLYGLYREPNGHTVARIREGK